MTGQNWPKYTVRLDGRSSFIEHGMELKKVCDFQPVLGAKIPPLGDWFTGRQRVLGSFWSRGAQVHAPKAASFGRGFGLRRGP
jgi:hypothetical protein